VHFFSLRNKTDIYISPDRNGALAFSGNKTHQDELRAWCGVPKRFMHFVALRHRSARALDLRCAGGLAPASSAMFRPFLQRNPKNTMPFPPGMPFAVPIESCSTDPKIIPCDGNNDRCSRLRGDRNVCFSSDNHQKHVASSWAQCDSGKRETALFWSPSKSALKAETDQRGEAGSRLRGSIRTGSKRLNAQTVQT